MMPSKLPAWSRSGLACALLAAGLPAAALAAPVSDRSPARIAQAAPTTRAAASPGEEDAAACSRLRRRLWVEGEGWVVRRVTTCR